MADGVPVEIDVTSGLAHEVQQRSFPPDAFLDVGVPRGWVLEPEGRSRAEMVEKEEEGVGIFGEPDLRRCRVGEDAERHPVERLPTHGADRVRTDLRVDGRRWRYQNWQDLESLIVGSLIAHPRIAESLV